MSDEPLKITFIPAIDNYKNRSLCPEPAVKHVPEWYKGLARFDKYNDDKYLHPVNNIGNDGATVSTKMCMPFFDALTAGYYYLLEDDLLVELDENGKPKLSWKNDLLLVDKRVTVDLALPDNTHPLHYGFRMTWFYKTPPGYSVLITHPMNRYDLPFYTMSGIVDSDMWGLPVFIGFFLKRNFQGVIPKGTPIMQIVPFKRDAWELEIDDSAEAIQKEEYHAEDRRSMLYGYYKKTAWIKKFFGVKHE
jgi:hypothetical protein